MRHPVQNTEPASPRTAAEPMAFTGWEYLHGAIFTVLCFTVAFPFAITAPGLVQVLGDGRWPFDWSFFAYLPLIMGFAGVIAAGVWICYGGPLAYVLGRALRREARLGVPGQEVGSSRLIGGRSLRAEWQRPVL